MSLLFDCIYACVISRSSPYILYEAISEGLRARINCWLICWIVGAWVNIVFLSLLANPCMISLDFLYSLVVFPLTSCMSWVLKIFMSWCFSGLYFIIWNTP